MKEFEVFDIEELRNAIKEAEEGDKIYVRKCIREKIITTDERNRVMHYLNVAKALKIDIDWKENPIKLERVPESEERIDHLSDRIIKLEQEVRQLRREIKEHQHEREIQ